MVPAVPCPDGATEKIDVFEWSSSHNPDGPMIGAGAMITNSDDGILLTWEATHTAADWSDWQPHLATISGSAASVVTPGGGFHTITPMLQLEDGSFIGTAVAGSYDPWEATHMIAFDASGELRWSVPNETPFVALEDGGLVTEAGVIYDENGRAIGQMGTGPTQSWKKDAYRIGSIDRIVNRMIRAAKSFWPFKGGNASGNNTALHHDWYPPLPSCTDRTLPSSSTSPGPNDLLRNATADLIAQLANDNACWNAAQQNVFSKLTGGDLYGDPITRGRFVGYLRNAPHFYDGTTSTLDYKSAKCGENYFRYNCQGTNPPQTVKDQFDDPNAAVTAQTVIPSKPFKSFWRPTYTPPGLGDDGFGVGIDPGSDGVNIVNESNLFHEALHGLTAMYDEDLQTAFNIGGGSVVISRYIRDNVLLSCPSFRE